MRDFLGGGRGSTKKLRRLTRSFPELSRGDTRHIQEDCNSCVRVLSSYCESRLLLVKFSQQIGGKGKVKLSLCLTKHY
jgi:hypothetical protein